ncbi:hypothetical protein IMZ48_26550 [Candidatus Bathyarchaeota archaeon]|nr:hypothetical protein [Candidatus Bathyarchaeota archaeon]
MGGHPDDAALSPDGPWASALVVVEAPRADASASGDTGADQAGNHGEPRHNQTRPDTETTSGDTRAGPGGTSPQLDPPRLGGARKLDACRRARRLPPSLQMSFLKGRTN